MTRVCQMTSAHKGTDTRIYKKECRSLARAGYDVLLVAPGESSKKDGVQTIGYGDRPRSRLARMTKAARAVYKIAVDVDADIYHFHDPELIPCALKLVDKGKRVVFDCHENHEHLLAEKEWLPKVLRRPLAALWRWFYRKSVEKFSAIVTVDPLLAAQFSKCSHVEVIANYPFILEDEAPERALESGKDDTFRLFFAGGLSPQWCHKKIIQAISDIENVEYVLCGPIMDKNYFEEISSLPGWKQVDYLGEIEFEEVQRIMRSCDAGLALLEPSVNTNGSIGTMGNTKLFEIMAAGLPVVCTNFEAWEPIVRNSCGYCVDIQEVGAIEEAIKALMNDRAAAQSLGAEGKRRVAEKYNWLLEEKKLRALYNTLEAQRTL